MQGGRSLLHCAQQNVQASRLHMRKDPFSTFCLQAHLSHGLLVTLAEVLETQLGSTIGLFLVANPPQRRSLGIRPSFIQETYPNQRRCLCWSMVYMEVIPALCPLSMVYMEMIPALCLSMVYMEVIPAL